MFNRKHVLSFGKVLYLLFLVITLFLPDGNTYSSEADDTPARPSRIAFCPGNRVSNESSKQDVWITIEKPVSGNCVTSTEKLLRQSETYINEDVEAIWVRCFDNEPDCENNIRPFKLGGCYIQCFHISGDGTTLSLSGITVCRKHDENPEWGCGWVNKTNGWAGWTSPPADQVAYDLDTSNWTCEGYKCITERPSPINSPDPDPNGSQDPITGSPTATPTSTSTSTSSPTYGDDPVDIREDVGCINGQYGWHDPTSGTVNVPDYMNDRTSCVAVDSGWSVMIYEHSNGQGGKKCLNHTVDDLHHTTMDNGVNANDVISSVQVFQDTNCGGQMPSGVADGDTITIHVDPNFAGTRWGVHDISSWNIPDYVQNQVSSVGVVPGWSVLMYEHQNTTGGVTCIAASDPDLSDNFFDNGQPVNNNIESMRSFYDGSCSGWSPATVTFTPSPTATATPTLTYTQTASATISSPMPPNGVELLPQQWHLTRSSGGSREAYQTVNSNVLMGRTHLRVTYDLHGLQALGGDASALIFDQNGWQYISLSNYGQNGKNGVQTVDIPLSHFSGLNLSQPVGLLHTRFWNSSGFTVDITSVIAYGFASATNTPTITFSATSAATQTMSPVPTLTLTSTPTIPATPTATSSSFISQFVLVRTDSDSDLFVLNQGATINLATLPSELNIRADVSTTVGSVVFGLDSNSAYHTENSAPYLIGSDSGGNYAAWNMPTGTHTIFATPYSGRDGTGIAGGTLAITFTVTNQQQATSTPTQTMQPTLTPTMTSTMTSTSVPTATASVTPTLTPSQTATVPSISEVELLPSVWHLTANGGAAELYQSIDPNVLIGRNTLRITYDLHDLEALPGDASALIFDQNGWQYISLSEYGQNGLDGVQIIEVPLSDFSGLNLSESVGLLHTRFWYDSYFEVDIISVVAFNR